MYIIKKYLDFYYLCTYAIILLVIFLGVLYWKSTHKIIEGYIFDIVDNTILYVASSVKDDISNSPVGSFLSVSSDEDILFPENLVKNRNTVKKSAGRGTFAGAGADSGSYASTNEKITAERIYIKNDACNSKFSMKSDYINNICLKDNTEINKKCMGLSKSNCTLTNCCIFLNGNKCVAGSYNGPTYLTEEDGRDIIAKSYLYKNKCYGNCNI